VTPRSETTAGHVSSFELDLLETGALDGDRAGRVKEHLDGCEKCRGERARLSALKDEFASEVFPRTRARFSEREPVAARFYRRPSVWVPALASAAAVALALGLAVPERRTDDAAAEIQLKGGTSLSLLARRNGAGVPISGSTVELRAGDELRFVVVTAGERASHVLIVSIDGAGEVSVYFPFQGGASGAVQRKGRWEVPGSVILDASPGPERVFVLVSDEPLEARPVLEALRRVGERGWEAIRATRRLELSAVEQDSVLIEKAKERGP
jgi:hypothetical protein